MSHVMPVEPKNQILEGLSQDELDRLGPHFEPVDLPHGKTLSLSGEKIEYVYFPVTAMVSTVATTVSGESIEVAVIGNEGATGLNVILGFSSSPEENMIQMAGTGIRIRTDIVMAEFARAGGFHDRILHFVGCLIGQISRIALCNRLHPTEKRLARWLLMCRDRALSDVLNITQEFLAVMLGANRPTVTLMAIKLQNAGLIKYNRGRVKIVDRPALEAYACDCYSAIKAVYATK